MSDKKYLFENNEWNFETLSKVWKEVEKIATDELRLDMYPMTIEIISADQMLDAYASHGLPVHYNHWSIGKRYLRDLHGYQSGKQNLAFEIIINALSYGGVIAYLMENNTALMQTVVLAHCTGHNYFFKHNYLFKEWTHADDIIDYMSYARDYIEKCEEKYGVTRVEEILDACHSISMNSVDKYKRKTHNKKETSEILKRKRTELEKFDDPIYNSINKETNKKSDYETMWKEHIDERNRNNGVLPQPEENLLYFIEKNSPILEPWEREICQIVRKTSQYWLPQMQTQVGNEGMASFCHYYIMNRLYDKGMISAGQMMEFIQSHTGVIFQTTPDLRTDEEKKKDAKRGKPHFNYGGINPYALGFAIMMDIKRICEEPTDEDKRWFPNLIGKDWVEEIQRAVKNYRDESFIRQYLSPKVIRDFKFFAHTTDEEMDVYEVSAIHNDEGYRKVREALAESKDINNKIPNISVTAANMRGNRALTLSHYGVKNRLLTEDKADVIAQVKRLWGYEVIINSFDKDGRIMDTYSSDKES